MTPAAPSILDISTREVAPEALAELLGAGDYEVLRLARPRFGTDRLVAALERVRRRFPLRPRNQDPSYRGICLQSCSDTDDPLYGLLNLRRARGAQPAIEPTAIAGEFAAVFEALSPHVALDRGRLLELHPGHVMPFHSDGAGNRRLHIPITTARDCLVEFEDGGAFHLPADGSCFLMNTERGHRATNRSPAPRVHLVFQARSLAAARDARATPKLCATITRHPARAPLDLAGLRRALGALDWQHANHRYAKAGKILSRATEVATDGTALTLVTEFVTLDDLGDFLQAGAIERLRSLLAEQGYRLETEIR
jgi:Aspartyl/Asparaginyl beta-hydroxylase